MIQKIKNIKNDWALWKIRWMYEPENCRKSVTAWLWFIPLFLTFNILTCFGDSVCIACGYKNKSRLFHEHETIKQKKDPIDLVKTQCRDGAKWAEYFINMHGGKLNGLDESDMIGWFCNAMMAMHDSIYNKEIQKLEAENKELKKEVEHLQKRDIELSRFKEAGVDNWDGY